MRKATKHSATDGTNMTEKVILDRLVARLGEIVPPAVMWREMGYPSAAAARVARQRGVFPIKVFELAGRRGFYAYTQDLAHWLAQAHRTGSR